MNRFTGSLSQRCGIGRAINRCLNDGEFVAAQTGNKVDISDAAAQSVGHALEQLVTGRMPECVIDALQMINVEVQDCQPLSPSGAFELLLKPLAKKQTIGQTGQPIMVRGIRNPLLGTLLFGDVFVGGDPSVVRDRIVHNGNDAPGAQVRYLAKDSSLANCGHNVGDILLDVIGEEATSCDPVCDDFPKGAARSDDLRR